MSTLPELAQASVRELTEEELDLIGGGAGASPELTKTRTIPVGGGPKDPDPG